MKFPDQANVIKIAAVVTATPRWVVALLASEGFVLPEAWKPYWVVFSVVSAAGMAIVEGVAFAYVFNAWKREATARRANVMLALAILSAVLFVVLLSPSIAASVRGQALSAILSNDWLLWLWSAVVAASTIAIVASVGYAQKQTAAAADSRQRAAEGGKLPAIAEKLPAELSQVAANGNGRRKFADLLPEEILAIADMSTTQVAAEFGLPERTARNWRIKAAEVLQVQATP